MTGDFLLYPGQFVYLVGKLGLINLFHTRNRLFRVSTDPGLFLGTVSLLAACFVEPLWFNFGLFGISDAILADKWGSFSTLGHNTSQLGERLGLDRVLSYYLSVWEG